MGQGIRKILSVLVLGVLVFMLYTDIARAGININVSGVANSASYNHDVTPTFSAAGATVSATLNGGAVSSGIRVATEGNYLLTVAAYSGSDVSFRNVRFAIDKTAPVISVGGVSNGQLTNGDIIPTFSANEGNVSATLNGGAIASGTRVSSSGNYLLTVSAYDAAGNTSFRNVRFAIDKTVPVITITGVVDGATYNDSRSIGISVNEGSYYATLNGAGFAGGTVSADGSYTLTVTASDSAGNVSSRQLWFKIDRSASPSPVPPITPTNVVTSTGGVRRALAASYTVLAQTESAEVTADESYLSEVSVERVENADVEDGSINSCDRIRVIGRAKDGLLVILYFKRDGSDTPVIGFVKAGSGNVFEFVSDEPLPAGDYTIYAKLAEVGGKTGPMLEVYHFEIEKCSLWVLLVWLIALLIAILLILLAWLLTKKRRQKELAEIEKMQSELPARL